MVVETYGFGVEEWDWRYINSSYLLFYFEKCHSVYTVPGLVIIVVICLDSIGFVTRVGLAICCLILVPLIIKSITFYPSIPSRFPIGPFNIYSSLIVIIIALHFGLF